MLRWLRRTTDRHDRMNASSQDKPNTANGLVDIQLLVNAAMNYMVYTVASLRWVTPGAATEGVTPLFFPEKHGNLFLVTSSAVSPLISSSQKLTTFFCSSLYRFFITFTRVSPPRGCHPHLSLPVWPRFSTILCKFAHKKLFSFGCYPPGGCHPGRSIPRLLPPIDTTGSTCLLTTSECTLQSLHELLDTGLVQRL